MPTFTELSRFTHPKLRFRLAIFFVIAIAIIGLIVKDVIAGELAWYLAAIALIIGGIIGYILGRLLTIKWHETEERAVSEMDAVGGIAIALYVVLEVSKDWVFGHFFSGVALSTFTLALLGGALFGRGIGLLTSINRVIEERA